MPAGAGGLRLVPEHGNNSQQGYTPMLLEDKSSFYFEWVQSTQGLLSASIECMLFTTFLKNMPKSCQILCMAILASFSVSQYFCAKGKSSLPWVRVGSSVPGRGLTALASRSDANYPCHSPHAWQKQQKSSCSHSFIQYPQPDLYSSPHLWGCWISNF